MFLVRNHLNLDFLKFLCILPFGTAILTFLNILLLSEFVCFTERKIQNFIVKFRENFIWRETVLSAHRMKSDENPVFLSNLSDF